MTAAQRRLVGLCLIAMLGVACEQGATPVGPSAVVAPAQSPALPTGDASSTVSTLDRQEKVAICHLTGQLTYVPIMVAARAVPAHLRHGDGLADGVAFDASCVPLGPADIPPPDPQDEEPPEDPAPVTLTCGAPAGAAYPGSSEPPGTPVDTTTGGVELAFSVTVSPTPTGETWLTRELIDTYATGELALPPSLFRLPDSGTFQGTFFVSGSVSFSRELRFTLADTATCSLFWHINPPAGS